MIGLAYFVYEGDDDNEPRDPTESDTGGTEYVDSSSDPPDRTTDPNAEHWDRQGVILSAISVMFPVAQIAINGGATPTVGGVKALNRNFKAGDVVWLVRQSAGVVEVGWRNGFFPADRQRPYIKLARRDVAVQVGIEPAEFEFEGEPITGVIVRTYDATTTPTDYSFTFKIG